MRISNSFSEGEIQVLDFIVQTLLRGGTPTMATRHKEFASLCRKVKSMKGRVHEKEKEVSSVGLIESPVSAVTSSVASDDDLAKAV